MLPLTVGIRDSVVQLVSTLGGVVSSARAGLGCIIVSAQPVYTVLTHRRVCIWSGARVGVLQQESGST